MSRFSQIVMMALIPIAAFYVSMSAQPLPHTESAYVLIQDSLKFPLLQNGRLLPASWFSPAYMYMMSYQPANHTVFTFTECRNNGKPLRLLAWNYNRVVHAPAELMSFNSRTANFRVRSGDTVSFYREMEWYNPSANRQDTSTYYALDTLEMVTYLVRAQDGRPLAQLDSIGILPRTQPGKPVIYGTHPIMAVVSYVIPRALDGDSVLVGVTIRARGSGAHHFMRRDGVTVGMSERLRQAYYQQYLAAIEPLYAKRNIEELMQGSGGTTELLRISRVAGSSRDMRIAFHPPRDAGEISILIYDEAGRLIASPYNSHIGGDEMEVNYRAPAAGGYFVALVHRGRIVRTEKVLITQ